MRKITFAICMAIVVTLSSCGFTQEDLDNARLEGYQYGYDCGYADGREYADKENASSTTGEKYQTSDRYNSIKDSMNENTPVYTQPKPINMPVSGTILSGKSGKEYYESEITVTANIGSSYVVSLKNENGVERISFFVRAGDTVTVAVPAEYLYVYFASGTSWYGYGKGLMFGDATVYSKDDDLLDFTQYTWEYTLQPVYNGNFTELPCDESEFFE